MSLYFASLNSGSNGNCYYVGNEHEAVLVDAGLSCRETERRMKRIDISMDKVRAIFVSHEHTDHVSGIPVLARKYQLPVYITPGTLLHGGMPLELQQVKPLKAFEPVCIGNLCITSFPKFHDAAEPHSFIITCNKVTVGVFTDLGVPCAQLTRHFALCHAAILEANYDEDMLFNGRYPYHLKRRISGGRGHLSNKQALEVFINHKPAFMSHLFLGHLSKDNNDPALVQQLFKPHAGDTEVIVASRDMETGVYHIKPAQTETAVKPLRGQSVQYVLF